MSATRNAIRTNHLFHVGDDATIVATRTAVLAKWNVTIATSDKAWPVFLENDFDLIVLCHSVPATSLFWLVKQISRESPFTPILIFSPEIALPRGSSGIVVSDEPKTLVTTIEEILRGQHGGFAKRM